MRKILWTAAAVAAIMPLAACGKQSTETTKAQSLSRMSSDVIATMDAQQMTDPVSIQTNSDTTSGFYRYDHKQLKPDMAKSMATVSKDQKTYTFHLRKGAKWSDGHQVTAQDFEYAWKRAVNPATKAPYSYIFTGIKNADAILAGKMSYQKLGVKAINKYTFQVKLDKVIPYFNSMITLPIFSPLEKSVVTKYGDKYATTAQKVVYNGPYLLKKWKGTDDTWTEVKNPNYWNAKNVKIKTIKYQVVKENTTAKSLYQSGKLDDITLSGQDAKAAKSQSGYNVINQNWLSYLTMNTKAVPAFKNQKVREALSLAIDREAYISSVLGDGSKPATSMSPTGMFYNPKTGADFAKETLKGGYSKYTTFDLKKAKKLFAEGMKEAGQTSLNFQILSDDNPSDKQTDEYLQGAFEKLATDDISVKIDVKAVPQKSWISLARAHNYGIVLDVWGADYPDASNFLDRFPASAAQFAGNWGDAAFNKYIAAAAGADATDPQKRYEDLLKANRIITEQVGVIPLYQWGTVHLTKTSVKDMQYAPNSIFQYIGTTNK